MNPPPSSPRGVGDDAAHLRDALKRCSPETIEAAFQYWSSGDTRFLPPLINGVIARFVEPELRSRLQDPPDDLRLVEDLALDSLTLMEIVLLAEDVLRISIAAEELRHFRTIADVHRFILWKVTGNSAAIAAALAVT